ncbi:hypothetical protein NXX53_14125 [Bacteroides salyersiae]|nr:hypothetical protein [Bacteroides salyersiae]
MADYVKFLTVKKYSAIAVAPEKRYKLAIVMGGFASMNRETGQMRDMNKTGQTGFGKPVRLWRNGTIEKILITGDGTSIVQPDGTSTEKPLPAIHGRNGNTPKSIHSGKASAKHPAKHTLYSRNTEKRKH